MQGIITHQALGSIREICQSHQYSQIFLLGDENTYQYCFPHLKTHLPEKTQLIQVPSGEIHKNLDTCVYIWNQLTEKQADRKSLLLNLGGGVIGDMGGFCAATFKRGIDFIQIPTTLLAQVDASVGGKLGIDFQGFKNHIGSFQSPKAVLVEVDFLSTLPKRELLSGFAEIIKHCLIADAHKWAYLKKLFKPDFWQHLSPQNFDRALFQDLVEHSIRVKEQIVRKDPKERGLRKILNFGHTLGHALETYLLRQDGRAILHGEAIAVGMICEAWISREQGKMKPLEYQEIEDYILSIYPYVYFEEKEIEEILAISYQDKKNEGGKIQASLLSQLGQASFNDPILPEWVQDSLKHYRALNPVNQ